MGAATRLQERSLNRESMHSDSGLSVIQQTSAISILGYLELRLPRIPCYLEPQLSRIVRYLEPRLSPNPRYLEPWLSRIPRYLGPWLSRDPRYLEPRISRISLFLGPRLFPWNLPLSRNKIHFPWTTLLSDLLLAISNSRYVIWRSVFVFSGVFCK